MEVVITEFIVVVVSFASIFTFFILWQVVNLSKQVRQFNHEILDARVDVQFGKDVSVAIGRCLKHFERSLWKSSGDYLDMFEGTKKKQKFSNFLRYQCRLISDNTVLGLQKFNPASNPRLTVIVTLIGDIPTNTLIAKVCYGVDCENYTSFIVGTISEYFKPVGPEMFRWESREEQELALTNYFKNYGIS